MTTDVVSLVDKGSVAMTSSLEITIAVSIFVVVGTRMVGAYEAPSADELGVAHDLFLA